MVTLPFFFFFFFQKRLFKSKTEANKSKKNKSHSATVSSPNFSIRLASNDYFCQTVIYLLRNIKKVVVWEKASPKKRTNGFAAFRCVFCYRNK